MKVRNTLLLACFILTFQVLDIKKIYAQNPTANFSIPTTSCINESVSIDNTSLNATNFQWYFCDSELVDNSPDYLEVTDNSNFIFSYGFQAYTFNEKVYGIGVRNAGLAYNYEFDSGFSSLISTSVYDVPRTFDAPRDIKLIKLNSEYIAFISKSGSAGIALWNFGNSPLNTPSTQDVNSGVDLQRMHGMEAVKDSSLFVFAGKNNSNRIYRLKYDTLDLSNPDIDFFTVNSYSDITGISIIEYANNWYGIASSLSNNKVALLYFGSSLSNTPTVTEIPLSNSINLSRAILVEDQSRLYGFIQSIDGKIVKLKFNDIESLSFDEDLISSYAGNIVYPIGYIEWKGEKSIYNVDIPVGNNRLNKFTFRENCDASISESNQNDPNVSYSLTGSKIITLTAFDAAGNSSTITKSITVTTDVAPDVSFSLANANRCVNTSLEFLGSSPETISSWEWSFGNGDSAFVQNPSYTYTTAGTYDVSLFVESANGCTNRYIETIEIFDEPIASFTSSSQGTICSRKPVDFSNTTVLPAPATFAWDFGDGNFSTEENPSHTYPNAGTYDVSLSIEMAGCTSTVTQSLTVNPGPEVSFSQINQCYGQVIEFQNTSTGEFIIGYEWDFGDGTQSTVSNPSHQFTSTGKKAIQLTALTSNGCNYTIIDSVEVFPLATVDFEIEPSCAGAPTQFLENVSVENSNIIAYNWDFGVSASSTDISSEANPLFTYASPGTYTVRLEVTTEDGCVTENSQQLEVNMLPQPEISYNTACLNENYNFSGNPNESISTEYWQIQDSLNTIVFTSTQSAFDYTFPYAGNFTITYRQQNDQLCSVTESLSLQVKELPQASFSVSDACVESNVNFVNTSELNGNELNQYSWYIDGNRVSQQQNFNFSFDQVGEYPISLELSTENGCQSIFRDTISIQALTDPFFELEQDIGAVPFDLDLNTTLNTGESAQWYLNGELIGTGEALQATIEEVGVYFIGLEVSNVNGCSEILNRQLSLKEPIMNIAIDNLRAIQGDTFTEFILTLTNKGSVVPSYYNINFDLGEYFITERLDAVILPGKTQNERLSVQLNNDQLAGIDRVCLSLSPVKAPFEESNSNDNSACVGISKEFKVLNIYPNPSNARVVIPIILPDSGTVEIILEQSNGQTARTETFEGLNRGYNELVVNKEELAPGVYFLRIRFEGQQKLKKIVFY